MQRFLPIGASLLRSLLIIREPRCTCDNRTSGKVAIITGPTSGIGYYTALDLANKGAVLYLACRDKERGIEVQNALRHSSKNENVTSLPLDFGDLRTVSNFVNLFLNRESKLDVIVHNAGIFHHPSSCTVDGIEITYQTNFIGPYLLTSLLQDTLQKSSDFKIVFVSSEAHRLSTLQNLEDFRKDVPALTESFEDFIKVYAISKLALHVYADYLSNHLPDKCSGSCIALVNPGNVWTNVYRNCWLSKDDLLIRIKCAFYMRRPNVGAQSSIHALNGHKVNRKYISYNKRELKEEDLVKFDEEYSRRFMDQNKKLVENILVHTESK